MKRYILFYGLLAVSLLMLFQFSSMWIFRYNASMEWIIVPVAIVSILIGIYFGRGVDNKEIAVQESVLKDFSEFAITEREYQVLRLIDRGHSNREVGEELFISENTVKTHVSNLLIKLNAKRRTEALNNAKDLKII